MEAMTNAMAIVSSNTESESSQAPNGQQKITRVTVSMRDRPGSASSTSVSFFFMLQKLFLNVSSFFYNCILSKNSLFFLLTFFVQTIKKTLNFQTIP